MKTLLVIMMFAVSGCSSSNNVQHAGDMEYATAIAFGSVCCGTVPDDFLKAYLKKYNQDHNLKIGADIAGGCGREGEFTILFKLDRKNAAQQAFIGQLHNLVKDTDTKNRNLNTSSGNMEILNDVKASDYAHCRLGVKPWN